jgi:hypothetical protein
MTVKRAFPVKRPSDPNRRVLHLNLRCEYFDAIAEGTKRIEYRDRTEYWATRLEGREYDVVEFRNGYATRAPVLQIGFCGVKKVRKWGGPVYAIQLGELISVKRWKPGKP